MSGIVSADGPNEAFEKAILLASHQWPEIVQSDKEGLVINADEVINVTWRLTVEIDRTELFWDEPPGV